MTEERSRKLIDKHRDINVDHVWWDCEYDNFKEDMEAIGIYVEKMHFSGFSSQGDGACFEGFVSDWRKFLPTIGVTCPAITGHAASNFQLRVRHSGNYYHEFCTHFDVDFPLPENDEDEDFFNAYTPFNTWWNPDDVRAAAWMTLINNMDYDAFESDCIEAFRGHMRDLYRKLNAEYDHLTSDDAVWETIQANELDK